MHLYIYNQVHIIFGFFWLKDKMARRAGGTTANKQNLYIQLNHAFFSLFFKTKVQNEELLLWITIRGSYPSNAHLAIPRRLHLDEHISVLKFCMSKPTSVFLFMTPLLYSFWEPHCYPTQLPHFP